MIWVRSIIVLIVFLATEVVIQNLLTSLQALNRPNFTEIWRYEGIRCITGKILRQITMKNE
jgi:hypothetical protein